MKTRFMRYYRGEVPQTWYKEVNGEYVKDDRPDLTGKRYGHLTVIARADDKYYGTKQENQSVMWVVRCDCGMGIFEICEDDLISGRITQCQYCVEKPSKGINEIGNVYGSLIVMSRDYSANDEHAVYVCKCAKCGRTISVRGSRLREGKVTSCGCDAVPNGTTHGLSKTRIYETWRGMHNRCEDVNHKDYPLYSKKGITVCQEWNKRNKNGLINFYNWAVDNGYEDSLTIDRKNNDLGYEPGNCQFVNDIAQANNKSTNVRIEYNGENHTMAEWSRITGIPYSTISSRYKKGLSPDSILKK